MQNITLAISGMSCGHCLNAVNRALAGLDGVEVKSVQMGRADLRVRDGNSTDLATAAISRAGYRVESVQDD